MLGLFGEEEEGGDGDGVVKMELELKNKREKMVARGWTVGTKEDGCS